MLDELIQANADEQEAFVAFQKKYVLENPAPRKPAAASYAEVGIEFYLLLVVTFAAMVMASLRTAQIFYRASSLDGASPEVSVVQAAFAMIAIEGGLVVYAFYQAKQRQKISATWMAMGVVFTLAISVFAGLGQSIALIKNLDTSVKDWFEYGLVLLMGAGGSFVAFVGGHISGQRLVEVDQKYRAKLSDYQAVLEEYRAKLLAAWPRSEEYRIAHGELKKVRVANAAVQSPRTMSVERSIEQPVERKARSVGPTQRVFNYLNEQYSATGQVPGPRDIERELGVSVGTASTARRDWINQYDPWKANGKPIEP